MEIFFDNQGVNLTNLQKTDKRYTNLNYNLTAINLSYDTHRLGRTNGPKNVTISKLDGVNSKSLEEATRKDIALILLAEFGNPENYKEALEATTYAYLRNKMLCLYDIK